MYTYADKVGYYRVASVGMLIFLIALLGACGTKTVEIDLPREGLRWVERAAPSEDFAFYVSSDSVPRSAGDLEQYAVFTCTDDGTTDRAWSIVRALDIEGRLVSNGPSDAECLEAATVKNVLVVTQRTNNPPSGVVEIVFK